MKNKNGYTVIELIVVIAVVGIFAFIAINKASYAFSDNIEAQESLLKQKITNIEKQAKRYGEEHPELFEESNTTYIRVTELIEAGYLSTQESDDNATSISDDKKIELVLKKDKVKANIEI